MKIVVFGGYGVFGSLVARELAASPGLSVTIAGRSSAQAEAFARTLGPAHRGAGVDLGDRQACRKLLEGHSVAVNCAGPFLANGSQLLEDCLAAGCHSVDIAEESAYARHVRSLDERFRERGLAALYGCSSLPAISGALGLKLRALREAAPERARVSVYVGNDNPKGLAAISSMVALLGRPIAAPQGTLIGIRGAVKVPLPEPFGTRTVVNYDGPDYDLFPSLLGVRAVEVKVGFELPFITPVLGALAALGPHFGNRTARVMAFFSKPFRYYGSAGGAVMTELFYADGSSVRASVVSRDAGQRMAALPCALAAELLARKTAAFRGAGTGYDVMSAPELLARLESAGFPIHVVA